MRTPVNSKAALFGHPIHPMLVTFPIAFLIGALATDLAWSGTRDPFWAEMSKWLLLAGIVMGVLAALAGFTDYVSRAEVRSHIAAHFHFAGNAVALVLAIVNLVLRWNDPAAAVLPWGLVLSAVTTGLLGLTGWLGGELAYRFGIGQMTEVGVTPYEPPSTWGAGPQTAANQPYDERKRSGTR